MARSQQSQSLLFVLPAELRDRVYEEVALSYEANDEPSFFRTCWQIRNEGLQLFYATHVFLFVAKKYYSTQREAAKYQHFLTCIGAAKAAMTEVFRFEFQAVDYDTASLDIFSTYIDIKVHAKDPVVTETSLSCDRAVEEGQRVALETARIALNKAWAAQGAPTKLGLLRTLPALTSKNVLAERY